MRKKLNKTEINQLENIADKLIKIYKKIDEKKDVQLKFGNGTACEQIECAIASLECILQEY